MKRLILLISIIVLLTGKSALADNFDVASPDGNIVVSYNPRACSYSVKYKGFTVVNDSRLGLVAAKTVLKLPTANVEATRGSVNTQWQQPWGENIVCTDNHNELLLTEAGANVALRLRAFNDGVAFRYEISANDSLVVMDELTEFNIPSASQTWSIAGSFETYELDYRHQRADSLKDANTPITFATPEDVYASIHEAALYDYPEMILRRMDSGALKADLAPLPNGVKAYIPGKFTTPWRTIQIAENAVGLINSCMILNLNEPSKIADTSWIEPQKYVGIWWGMHLGTQTWTMGRQHGATTENAIKYIDFASENNLQGVLFEGWNEGWENWGGNQHFDYLKAYNDFDIDSIARYASSKDIQLWMHDETGGNIPEFEAVLDSAFAYYASLGVHTVKTGYAGGFKGGYFHHSQYGVKHYQRVVETAARYNIMIDAHEPIKETGIRRTWPNMMTREGARGMEWNAWSEGNSATYLCTLPFVRLLSGPMDYTPGIFDIYYKRAKSDPNRIQWNGPNDHCYIKTTLARQIANWVIIYSPLQMAADQIENYEGHPAFQFFRDFDANCQWSEALQGEIGEYIAVVRQSGNNFFLGAGTNSEPRTLHIPLSFLDPNKEYECTQYCDVAGHPDKVEIIKTKVTASNIITVEMQPAGGQAISFMETAD